jgi:hypothetical protein
MSMDMPIIRLEIEGMKHSIVTALAAHGGRVSKAVEAEIDHFLTTFDWSASVRSAMVPILNSLIADAVKRHFEYGEGRALVMGEVVRVLEAKKRRRRGRQPASRAARLADVDAAAERLLGGKVRSAPVG